jgi:hypothetical protein
MPESPMVEARVPQDWQQHISAGSVVDLLVNIYKPLGEQA